MKRLIAALEPYFEDGAKIMLFMFLSLAAVIFIVRGAMAIPHRYPLDYGEAPLVDQAMHLAAGQNIYRPDLTSPPYTISNYPPLFALLLTPLVKTFGPAFQAGRVISLLSTLASAVFIGQIIYTLIKDRVAAIITGMLFLAIPYVVGWSPLLRVDMLALAFSTAGMYVVVRWTSTRRGLVIGGLLLVAAIYTRQSFALAAPLGTFVWLWMQNKRRAIGFAAWVGGVSLALFFILNTLTRGGFYFNIITANINEYELERLEWWLSRLLDAAPIMLVLGGAFLFLGFSQMRSPVPGRRTGWSLLSSYLIGASLSALTIGKIGSNENYLLEFSAALSLTAGAVIGWSRERRWQRAVLLVLLALQTGQFMQTTLVDEVEGAKWRLKPMKQLSDLEWIVETADGPVLGDEFMGMITLQDRPLYIQPFEVTQLANAGLWDQRPLLESIRNQDFPVILIHHFMEWPVYKERWTQEMLSAILQNYAPTDFIAETIVYQPTEVGMGGITILEVCPGAPWRLPTSGTLGMWWITYQLAFMGEGYENRVPVYAVANGLLMRRPDWNNAVAIQHDDPVRQGEKVWSFYGGMSDSMDEQSFVVSDFPPGSVGVPVNAGQLLGYQGMWSGEQGAPIWVHLHFAVVAALQDGSFPDEIVSLVAEGESDKTEPQFALDPSPYIGTIRSQIMGIPTWLPLRCREDMP